MNTNSSLNGDSDFNLQTGDDSSISSTTDSEDNSKVVVSPPLSEEEMGVVKRESLSINTMSTAFGNNWPKLLALFACRGISK